MEEKICTETIGVLRAIEKSYSEALPPEIIEYLLLTCDVDNIPQLDSNKGINEQNISEDTKAFLTILKLKYWCKTQEEKNELLKKVQENEEKYNVLANNDLNSDLFNNQSVQNISNQTDIEENSNLIEVSEKQKNFKNIFKRFLNFIKRIFN